MIKIKYQSINNYSSCITLAGSLIEFNYLVVMDENTCMELLKRIKNTIQTKKKDFKILLLKCAFTSVIII